MTRIFLPKIITISKHCRCFSHSTPPKYVRKYVYVSQSTDIYTNLALEDWIYTNVDFNDKEILMLWQNQPCVVIGRHQNPWLEANVAKLSSITTNGVSLARRNSGGGTVYHDEGNLNMTFFTTKKKYNRKHNLEIITRALLREYHLKVDISKREDLVVGDYKVSGTASKLGRNNSYHHCTLLINANKSHIHQALHNTTKRIETTATRSIKSPVLNLQEINRNVTIEGVLRAIGFEFQHSPASPVGKTTSDEIVLAESGFRSISPDEVSFQGIDKIRENLISWDWIFGKCRKFSVLESVEILDESDSLRTFNLKTVIDYGKINDIRVTAPGVTENELRIIEGKLLNSFKDSEYSEESVNNVSSLARKIIHDICSVHKDEAVNR